MNVRRNWKKSAPKIVAGLPQCGCGIDAKFATASTEKNNGREFIACPVGKVSEGGCGKFWWRDEIEGEQDTPKPSPASITALPSKKRPRVEDESVQPLDSTLSPDIGSILGQIAITVNLLSDTLGKMQDDQIKMKNVLEQLVKGLIDTQGDEELPAEEEEEPDDARLKKGILTQKCNP